MTKTLGRQLVGPMAEPTKRLGSAKNARNGVQFWETTECLRRTEAEVWDIVSLAFAGVFSSLQRHMDTLAHVPCTHGEDDCNQTREKLPGKR